VSRGKTHGRETVRGTVLGTGDRAFSLAEKLKLEINKDLLEEKKGRERRGYQKPRGLRKLKK